MDIGSVHFACQVISLSHISQLVVSIRVKRYLTIKRVVRKLLFDILEKGDDYIQIRMIIQKEGTMIDTLVIYLIL